jgi:hypothetical protein
MNNNSSPLVIRELLTFYSKLSWFNFVFLKMKRPERIELMLYAVLCIVAAGFAISTFPSTVYWGHTFRASLAIFLLVFAWLCLRGVLLDGKAEKIQALEYARYFSSGEQFNRYTLKVQLLKERLEELKCSNKESIDSIINVLKYEAGIPAYQPTWHKVFNSLFFLMLGALISLFVGIADKSSLTPLWELMKFILVLLFMLIAVIFVLQVTLVKLVADWKMSSRYQVELIRFLEEIKIDMTRSAKAPVPEITDKPARPAF